MLQITYSWLLLGNFVYTQLSLQIVIIQQAGAQLCQTQANASDPQALIFNLQILTKFDIFCQHFIRAVQI